MVISLGFPVVVCNRENSLNEKTATRVEKNVQTWKSRREEPGVSCTWQKETMCV